MVKQQNPNLELLELVIAQLGELADDMVFVGGCATGLLITDPAAPQIRITNDVDAIVQVLTKAAYYQLSDKLRTKGFKEDTNDDAPLCRWVAKNVILDVMPTEKAILGFGNQWYKEAALNASRITLPSGNKIHSVSAPYFLITKLEAFDGRGHGDYLLSHDIEDIIAVMDGRPEIVNEVIQSTSNLVAELSIRFQILMKDARFVEAVSGHMPTDDTSQARVVSILNTMQKIADSK